jgi:diguanylate cyclase (GGDEF)-like protein
VGDRALCEVARLLRATIRPYDICVRYAGDEFIVVLSGCGADEAEQKRLELQQGIDAVYFEARAGKRLPLGLSIGTAVFPHDGESYETLLATADSRMYQDKAIRKRRSGRTGGRGPAQPEAGPGTSTRELTDGDIQRAATGIL